MQFAWQVSSCILSNVQSYQGRRLTHSVLISGLALAVGVDHRPLIPATPRSGPEGGLRVTVSSIRVDPNQGDRVMKSLRRDFEREERVRFCLLKKDALGGGGGGGGGEERRDKKDALSCILLQRKASN